MRTIKITDLQAAKLCIGESITVYPPEKPFRINHGMRDTPEHTAWKGMRYRCTRPNHPDYPNYGGRGIKVCSRWENFIIFYDDMGPKPSDQHSIERMDNTGNYEPSNCKWGTPTEQSINQKMQRNNTSGYRGVHFKKSQKKWLAQVNYKKTPYFIGYFDTPIEAATARDEFIVENGFPHKLSTDN